MLELLNTWNKSPEGFICFLQQIVIEHWIYARPRAKPRDAVQEDQCGPYPLHVPWGSLSTAGEWPTFVLSMQTIAFPLSNKVLQK